MRAAAGVVHATGRRVQQGGFRVSGRFVDGWSGERFGSVTIPVAACRGPGQRASRTSMQELTPLSRPGRQLLMTRRRPGRCESHNRSQCLSRTDACGAPMRFVWIHCTGCRESADRSLCAGCALRVSRGPAWAGRIEPGIGREIRYGWSTGRTALRAGARHLSASVRAIAPSNLYRSVSPSVPSTYSRCTITVSIARSGVARASPITPSSVPMSSWNPMTSAAGRSAVLRTT
jgi:hypothetical protein